MASITSFHDVTPNNEAQLVAAASQGPVAVAVEADQSVFQSYKVEHTRIPVLSSAKTVVCRVV